MNQIIEPIPTGLRGRLCLETDGICFIHDGIRHVLGNHQKDVSPLQPGDVLIGTMQVYDQCEPQSQEVIRHELEEAKKCKDGDDPNSVRRFRFRVDDFERLGESNWSALSLQERKQQIDRRIEDGAFLQKNPYLILAEDQTVDFLSDYSTGLQWSVRNGGISLMPGLELNAPSGVSSPEQYFIREKETNPGSKMMSDSTENYLKQLQVRLLQSDENCTRLQEEIIRLNRLRREEALLRTAGSKYLEKLQARSERCLRVLHLNEEDTGWIENSRLLFASAEISLEQLEKHTEDLERQMEALYPTQPIARASVMDFPGSRTSAASWNSFQFPRNKTGD